MLIKSVVFAILVFLMPMIECGSSLSSLLLHSTVRGAASLFYLRDYYAVCKTSMMYAPRQMQRALDIFVKRVFFEDFLWGLFRTLAAGSGSETGSAWGKTPGHGPAVPVRPVRPLRPQRVARGARRRPRRAPRRPARRAVGICPGGRAPLCERDGLRQRPLPLHVL